MTDLEKQMLNNEYLKILKDPRFSDLNVNFLEFWWLTSTQKFYTSLFNGILNQSNDIGWLSRLKKQFNDKY